MGGGLVGPTLIFLRYRTYSFADYPHFGCRFEKESGVFLKLETARGQIYVIYHISYFIFGVFWVADSAKSVSKCQFAMRYFF